ncbi:hypothetical protein NDU88_007146 [Pleurodeles waltl]|uniref:Uncharacterized protein n=1 Tax=Pleurodeles waltl TaxID=8319 RepID=A0AAV7NVE6_PLEWA|nr:hypothetical protein NDU88_007146 [Pleurodeles waltl]
MDPCIQARNFFSTATRHTVPQGRAGTGTGDNKQDPSASLEAKAPSEHSEIFARAQEAKRKMKQTDARHHATASRLKHGDLVLVH